MNSAPATPVLLLMLCCTSASTCHLKSYTQMPSYYLLTLPHSFGIILSSSLYSLSTGAEFTVTCAFLGLKENSPSSLIAHLTFLGSDLKMESGDLHNAFFLLFPTHSFKSSPMLKLAVFLTPEYITSCKLTHKIHSHYFH